MRILALDPKKTHEHNPTCKMRVAPSPNGKDWYCLDCGCPILWTTISVEEGDVDIERAKKSERKF